VIADRFSQRPVMIASDAVRFATQGVLAVLLFTDTATLWQIAVLYGIHGLCGACFMPARSGPAPQVVPAEDLQQANALRWATDAGGDIAGPALAGVIVAFGSPAWAVAVDSLTFLISTVTLAMLRLPSMEPVAAAPILHQLFEGWLEFSSRSWLWVSNIQAAVTNAVLLAPFFGIGPVSSPSPQADARCDRALSCSPSP
jgi:MFS family permease